MKREELRQALIDLEDDYGDDCVMSEHGASHIADFILARETAMLDEIETKVKNLKRYEFPADDTDEKYSNEIDDLLSIIQRMRGGK